jgi:hypothetical protein
MDYTITDERFDYKGTEVDIIDTGFDSLYDTGEADFTTVDRIFEHLITLLEQKKAR